MMSRDTPSRLRACVGFPPGACPEMAWLGIWHLGNLFPYCTRCAPVIGDRAADWGHPIRLAYVYAEATWYLVDYRPNIGHILTTPVAAPW